ncbi:MAG: DoxX family protein [Actinophytocola sp.]|nr:DoxX family protein [Actinophytocola sp.]
MNIALWAAQFVLAFVFLVSGTCKSLWSKERLVAAGQTGVQFFPLPAIRLIAASELLAVVGVTLPWLIDVAPILTPLAAVGLGVVMIGATTTHIKLREPKNIVITCVIFVVCVFVAIGRFVDVAREAGAVT